MGSKEQLITGSHAVDNELHVLVETLMGFFDRIEHWGLEPGFFSQRALLVHVGAANHLDAEVVVELFGSFNLHRQHVGHALEIALVAVHDDYLMILV